MVHSPVFYKSVWWDYIETRGDRWRYAMVSMYLNDHTALIDAQPLILVTSRFPRRCESELSRSAPEWEGHSQTENQGRDFSR